MFKPTQSHTINGVAQFFGGSSVRKSIFPLVLLFSMPHLALAWSAADCKRPNKSELKKTLTKIQYSVTQEDDTEKPYSNPLNEESREGIYVDITTGEPLFSSKHKFNSGTGWPSFYQPISKEHVIEKPDNTLFTTRTEVRSKCGDAHLGHVFTDGPKPTGLRYCMNGAALKFIPKEDLKKAGYEEYLKDLGASAESKEARAVFAGGCFWCMEPPFDQLKGVLATTSGYIGGEKATATYDQVSKGGTGHLEVIEITYDAKQISYSELLKVYWKNIDPYDDAGQFCDKGEQYKSAVFYSNEEEKKEFEKIKADLVKKGQLKEAVATQLIAAKTFYPAEDYHQNYYLKNPIRYKYYRGSCGRDKRLKELSIKTQ